MTDRYAPDLALFINGSWRVGEGRDAQTVVNPASGATLADVPLASAADLDEALDAADKGFKLWRATDVETRAGILRKAAALMRERADDIARMLTTEQGKPLAEARGEVIGIPVEHRRATDDFAARLSQGLALFSGQHPGNIVGAFADQ